MGLLDGPRARGAFVLRSLLAPPWSMRIEDRAPLTVVAVVRGRAAISPDGEDDAQLHEGDVALIRGPDGYTVADPVGTAPQVLIGPGQRCEAVGGGPAEDLHDLGVRTWGNAHDGADTVLLTGTYTVEREVSRRLRDALPPLLRVSAAQVQGPIVELLAAEVTREEPGQEAVLDRLLDLHLIAVLRAWFAHAGPDAPGWYRAHGDPIAGPALRLMQHAPDRPWTLASLAAEVGASRATLARRFTDTVGEPPMTFLTNWRLALAADLLREPGATVGSVAAQVGYGSSFALSTAFKRVRGVTPAEHRSGPLSKEVVS
jgi:AraC-like DNA-binding protein